MRKLLLTLFVLLLSFILIACGSNKPHNVDIIIDNIEKGYTTLKFDVIVTDEEQNLEGKAVILELIDQDEKIVYTKNLELEVETHNISISSLTKNTTYTLKIKGTAFKKPVVLYNEEIRTKDDVVIKISTVEQFFNIKNDIEGNYELANDIDFKDVKITNANQVTEFRGVFDGKGYAIKNYHIESYNAYTGIFGRVTNYGEIKNIVIDGIAIGTNEKPLTVDGIFYGGLLAGQVNNINASISNIVIKNSSMNIVSQTTSSSVYLGGAVGYFVGKATNISSENTTINVTYARGGSFHLGGLIGGTPNLTSAESTSFSKLASGTDLNLKVQILSATSNRNHLFYIGGAIGFLRNNKASNLSDIYATGNLNIAEVTMKSASNSANKVENTKLIMNIGGVVGRTGSNNLVNAKAFGSNAFFSGVITFKHDAFELVEGSSVTRTFNIGGLVGEQDNSLDINRSVVNGTITVDVIDVEDITLNIGAVAGKRSHAISTFNKDKIAITSIVELVLNSEVLETEDVLLTNDANTIFTSDYMKAAFEK